MSEITADQAADAQQEAGKPPAEKPKRTSSTTKYVVLELNGDDWAEVDRLETRSSKEAVRAYLDANEVSAGTFVAVPERSFEPVTVKTETVARRMFS